MALDGCPELILCLVGGNPTEVETVNKGVKLVGDGLNVKMCRAFLVAFDDCIVHPPPTTTKGHVKGCTSYAQLGDNQAREPAPLLDV